MQTLGSNTIEKLVADVGALEQIRLQRVTILLEVCCFRNVGLWFNCLIISSIPRLPPSGWARPPSWAQQQYNCISGSSWFGADHRNRLCSRGIYAIKQFHYLKLCLFIFYVDLNRFTICVIFFDVNCLGRKNSRVVLSLIFNTDNSSNSSQDSWC